MPRTKCIDTGNGPEIVPLTAEEEAARDAEEAAFAQWVADEPVRTRTEQRADALSRLDAAIGESKLLRAVLLVLLDELNGHAAKINAILDAVDAAGTLANLKTRVAAIADYPTRTTQQARTAIAGKITAGDVDS